MLASTSSSMGQLLLLLFGYFLFQTTILATASPISPVLPVKRDATPESRRSSPPEWVQKAIKDQKAVTWGFTTPLPSGLDEAEITKRIQGSFKQWSQFVGLEFSTLPRGQQPNIEVGWYKGDHSAADHGYPENEAFDGSSSSGGDVIAHGLQMGSQNWPIYGVLHFDGSNSWNKDQVESVSLHEIGHILGLHHLLNDKNAVMYPTANGVKSLTNQDKAQAQVYYGPYAPIFYNPGAWATGTSGMVDYDLKSSRDLGFALDYKSQGAADHMVFYRPGTGIIYIMGRNDFGRWDAGSTVFTSSTGIGQFNLLSDRDRGFAFDYKSTGKLDHICFYRPGTGAFFIVQNNGGTWSPVYAQGDPGQGIGAFDLKNENDKAFAYDYDHSGKMDHIVLYRPGSGVIFIIGRDGSGNWVRKWQSGVPAAGIGGYDLRNSQDQLLAYDYDGQGKFDHIIAYRPGSGIIFVIGRNGNSWTPKYQSGVPARGIGGYDLLDSKDRIIATGPQQLLLYRPGRGAAFVVTQTGSTFTPYHAVGDGQWGIGGFDLASTDDKAFAMNYGISNKDAIDHIVLYRPGGGMITVLDKK